MNKRKTLILEAFRNIKNRIVAFLSIITIMALGVSGIMGMLNLEASMKAKGNDFYKTHNFHDFEMEAGLGITDEDIKEISETDGVAAVEGVFRADGVIHTNTENGSVNLVSKTEKIDLSDCLKGAFPEKDNECAVNESAAKKYSLKIGDTISLKASFPSDFLKKEEFVITGIMSHPSFIGQREYAVLLNPVAFDTDKTKGRFTSAVVCAILPEQIDYYSKEYKKTLKPIKARLDEYAEYAESIRGDDAKEEANRLYDDARKEVDSQLSDAEKELTDGETTMKEKFGEKEEEIADAEKKLAEGKETLREEIAKAEKQIKDGEKELQDKLTDGKKQIEEGRAKADAEFASALLQLQDAENKYNEGCTEYEEGKKKYDDGMKQLEEAAAKLDEAKARIDEGNQKLIEALNDENAEKYCPFFAKVTEGMVAVKDEIETEFPDIKENGDWQVLCRILSMSEEGIERFRTETPAERAEYLKYAVPEIDRILSEAPHAEQIRAALQAMFEKIGESFPALEQLRNAADQIRQLAEGEKEYAEGKKQLDEKMAEAKKAGEELRDAKGKLEEASRKILDGYDQLNRKKQEVYAELDKAEKDLEAGRKDGEQKLKEAKETLVKTKAEKEKELEDAEKELREGKEEFLKAREEKEQELSDGWNTFYEKKAEAEDELAGFRKKIDEIGWVNYLVNNRGITASYTELAASISTIGAFEMVFTPVFAIVAGMVFFSTIAIIIDEQKKQVGGVKALGFYVREILFKYLVFSGLGALSGIIIGFFGGLLITKIVISPIMETYYFGAAKFEVAWARLTVFAAICLTAGTLVALFACMKLVRCSAIGLINGSEPVKRTRKRKRKNTKSSRGLYTRLIINNVLTDWERVLVSVIVITGSTCLVGFGYTFRYCFNEANHRQIYEINNYSFQVVADDDHIGLLDDIEQKITNAGGTFAEAHYETFLVDLNEENEGFILISANPDELASFYTVTSNGRKTIPVSKGGVMFPRKCYERLKKTKEALFYDMKLYSYDVPVAGVYENYLGFVGLSDMESYEEIFHKEAVVNSLFVRCPAEITEKMKEEISAVSEGIVINNPDYLRTKGANVEKLFNLVTVIMVVLAVILSFMILINLTSILVNRRMKEMLVMRINGFSMAETIGYVARESVFTFFLGVISGVILGSLICLFFVPAMESTQLMFVRTPYPLAWIMAFLFNFVFSVVIDFVSFRKIFRVPITDINKY